MNFEKVNKIFQRNNDFLGLKFELTENGCAFTGNITLNDLPEEEVFVYIGVTGNFVTISFSFAGFKFSEDRIVHLNQYNEDDKIYYTVFLEQEEYEEEGHDLTFDYSFISKFCKNEKDFYAILDFYFDMFFSDSNIEKISNLISKLERV